MLTGVIVGVVAMVVASIARAASNEGAVKQMTRVFAAHRAGGVDAARAEVDKTFPPTQWPKLASRYAALALIGDRATLEREVDAIDGPLKRISYYKSVGLLACASVGDGPARANQLAEHVAICERDLPRVMSQLKKWLHGIAQVGSTLGGASSDALKGVRPGMIVPANMPWVQVLLWDAVVRSFERDGKTQEATNARANLAHLERAKQAS